MKATSFIMLTAAAALALACTGNNVKYDVTGNNAPEDGKVVFLVDRLTSSPIDSAVVADGTFNMHGKAVKDAYLSVQLDGTNWYYPFFNDGEPVAINFADSTLTGSALNIKLNEWDLRDAAESNKLTRLVQEFLSLPEEEQQAREEAFYEEYRAMGKEYADFYLNLIEENKDNLIPVVFLQSVQSFVEKEKFDELVSSDAPFAKHPYTVQLKDKLEKAEARRNEAEEAKKAFIGQKFLDLEEADPDGNLHKLSEYAGQGNWVLVDFWASWCGPCKAEMPNVVAAYKKYHPKGLEIVGVSFDKEKEPWVKAIAEWEMPWIHISDLQYWKNAASEIYSVNAIPDNLLIDPEGTIVARGLRGAELEAKLATLFE